MDDRERDYIDAWESEHFPGSTADIERMQAEQSCPSCAGSGQETDAVGVSQGECLRCCGSGRDRDRREREVTAPLDAARLDEIEAAVPTIAPGPWRLERGNALGEWVVWSGEDDPILQILIWGSEIGPFIEAVRTIVPELTGEIRRLTPLLARAQARVEIAESARDGLEAAIKIERGRTASAERLLADAVGRIANARSEIARRDVNLGHGPVAAGDVREILADIETHLVDPEYRPAPVARAEPTGGVA